MSFVGRSGLGRGVVPSLVGVLSQAGKVNVTTVPSGVLPAFWVPSRHMTSKSEDKGPKRPPNAYSLFVKEKYAKMKEMGTKDMGMLQNTVKIAKEWKEMPDSAKQKYKDQAEAAKNPIKEEHQYKRQTGYTLFAKEYFKEHTHDGPKDVSHEWKHKSEEEKAKYKARAAEMNHNHDTSKKN